MCDKPINEVFVVFLQPVDGETWKHGAQTNPTIKSQFNSPCVSKKSTKPARLIVQTHVARPALAEAVWTTLTLAAS